MSKKYNFNRFSSTRYGMDGSPCGQGRDCPDRTPACHSTCEKYLAWKNERDERKAEWLKQKAKETAFGERYMDKLKRLGLTSSGKPVKR